MLTELCRSCKWYSAAVLNGERWSSALYGRHCLDTRWLVTHNYTRNGSPPRRQNGGVARRGRAASAPGSRAGSPLRSAALLRPTGCRAGQVPDAAPRRDRSHPHRHDRRGLRLFPVRRFIKRRPRLRRPACPACCRRSAGRGARTSCGPTCSPLCSPSRAAEGASARVLAGRIQERFGLSIHPRSIERAWQRQKKKRL